MYFDVTFGIFLSLKWLFIGETVGENFHLRNSTLTVTILVLHGSFSKIEGELFCQKTTGSSRGEKVRLFISLLSVIFDGKSLRGTHCMGLMQQDYNPQGFFQQFRAYTVFEFPR